VIAGRFTVTFCALLVRAHPLLAQHPPKPQDTLAYATAPVTIREKPFADAKRLGNVATGGSLRIYECSAGWCSVHVKKNAGYVLEEYLTRDAPVAAATPQGRGYTNSKGEWVPSPTRTPDNQPPAGASAQCRDGTYSFSRSRSGTCSHHGGVARWLSP